MKITYIKDGKETLLILIAESKLPELISCPFTAKVAAKVFDKLRIDAKKIGWSKKAGLETWLHICIGNRENGSYSDWQIFEGEIKFYAN